MVTLHLSLGPQTERIISRDLLEMMKSTAFSSIHPERSSSIPTPSLTCSNAGSSPGPPSMSTRRIPRP